MDGAGSETIFTHVAAQPLARVLPYLSAQAPQTVAALLLLFPHARAAEVLSDLDGDLRARVLRCMTTTRSAMPEALDAVARVLRAELLEAPEPAAEADRSADLARIVEAMPLDQREAALAALQASPPVMPKSGSPALPDVSPPLRLSPGLAAMLNTRIVEYDRLPMLEVVMDRFVRLLSTNLRSLSGRPVEVGLSRLRSVRFGDWIVEGAGRWPLLAAFRAVPWDNYALLAPDRDLLEGIGEVLLGGDRETASLRTPGRPLTGIDRGLAEHVVTAVLTDLGTAFGPIGAVTFVLDRVEENPRYACIARLHSVCFLAELDIALDNRSGRLEMLIPYATLEPVRESLGRMFMGERFGKDPLWQAHFSRQLARASIRLRTVAGTATLSVGAMLAWRAGTVLEFDTASSGTASSGIGACGDVTITAGGVAVARGVLGRRGTRWAVAPHRILIDNGDDMTKDPARIAPVSLPIAAATKGAPDLTAVHKVKVRVSAVVGETEMSIEDLLCLGRGGIVELDRRVGELIEVYANDRVVAKGELVVVDDRLAVSLSEIAAAED